MVAKKSTQVKLTNERNSKGIKKETHIIMFSLGTTEQKRIHCGRGRIQKHNRRPEGIEGIDWKFA